ncbi:MAG: cobalamin biosynthesis protein CbiG, partial [Butyrivibrio sp.]|nr:cobalamin biosynthesis protein CbiG [Butyrivibrio sp.]
MNTDTRGRKHDKGNNAFLCFSERGYQLAERIRAATGGDISRTGAQLTLDAWTRDAFASYDALIYIGASGIAVRAVAPYLKDKTTDPAVLVIDETGRFVIPLVSGHLGGSNALAKRIADITGAEAVITTATDRHGVFAVDEWARVQGFYVANPERFKSVSAMLFNGESVTVHSVIPVDGKPPAGVSLTDKRTADVSVGFMEDLSGLRLV